MISVHLLVLNGGKYFVIFIFNFSQKVKGKKGSNNPKRICIYIVLNRCQIQGIRINYKTYKLKML